MEQQAQHQQLLAALHALYHHEDASVKDQANKWLEQWQQSVAAWSISDAVLHDTASSVEAQYFCAQTLRTKVQRDFEELPLDSVPGLRESLVSLLLKHAKGAPPVRTQLCLALVALTVHLPAQHWATQQGQAQPMGGPVTWLAQRLQGESADLSLPCLLELLTVMPQEINSFKYAVRPERRREHAVELRGATGAALDLLTSCWNLPPGIAPEAAARLRPAVLSAFSSWLRLSEGAAMGPDGSALPSHPLVRAALEGLGSSGPLFSACVDAVSELVWVSVDPESLAITPLMMPLVQALVPAVMALRPRFRIALSRAAAEEGNGDGSGHARQDGGGDDPWDDDDAAVMKMALLFAELGEAYLHLIATAVQEVQGPVEALLEVAAHPEARVAALSFNFWHKLAKALTSGWGPRDVGADSAPADSSPSASHAVPPADVAAGEMARRRAFFTPAYERLVVLVRGRVRYPSSCTRWSREQHEEFRKQRHEVADTLEDCCAVLHYAPCLGLVCQPLLDLSASVAAGRHAFDWRQAEAALFCVRAIGPHTEADKPGQPAQLAQLLAALPGMPQEPLLQCCICYLITRYGDWLARGLRQEAAGGPGAGQPGALRGVLLALLQLAVRDLELPEASSAASCALLDMCCQCAPFLGEAVQPLLQLYQQLLGAGAVGQAAAAGGGPSGQGAAPGGAKPSGIAGVAEEDVHTIMQAVCVATSRCLPPEQHPQAFHTLLQPALAQLQAAATALPLPSSPPAPGPRSPPLATQHPCLCPLLDRLAVLLSHTPTRPLAAQMMAQIWPGLDLVFERAAGDVRILERGCRLLRVGVKAAAREGGQLLPTLLPALVRHFQASSHSAFVYSLSEVLKVWGAEAASIGPVAEALTLLLQHATQQLTTYQQISSNPELMDDTFLLALRALTYSPRLLLGSQATSPGSQLPSSCLPALMECVTQGVLVQHREACMSVLSFLMRLLSRSLLDEVPDAASVLQALLAPRAAGLTRLLLAGVVGVLPTVRLPDLASVLGALLLMAGREGVAWVTAALESLPNNTVGAADKQAFASAATFVGSHAACAGGPGSLPPAAERGWEGAVEDLADLCRRNGKVRLAAQQALLPPQLAAAITV